ncbi:MAG: hypothetical protein Q8927_11980 [Bacteroidota bacterium]|nr:hypothetical protein [Bacteroidota bacterium]MDP4216910.1 hypothetical protein [Bacteroidota bacterium]MDP4245437.1 hypothetical protein [Bacteroidota bacterium]MDP4254612.1 hypothetical protein [Bacteroidota bacterium]MDP4258541.1 hypothetical protein [Bacteroidota bacterium]
MAAANKSLSVDIYLDVERFQNAVNKFDRALLARKQIEVYVGTYVDCAVLKLYKRSWANPSLDPLTSPSRIFFSIWINPVGERKLFYNIHALKLRELIGYKIESRKFADAFRTSFKEFEHKWKNVSIKFGPLTLMQGSVNIEPDIFQQEVLGLSNNFLEIEHLVDNALARFKS